MITKIDRNLENLGTKTGRDFWFYFIPLIMATVFLAGTAAYFSVFGLSKVFAGAKEAAIIMASAIEFGKIIAVSFTNRYWNSIGKLRGYLLAAIIVAMVVTSASIFGFLSDAYQKTASKFEITTQQIEIKENQKTQLNQQIANYNQQIDFKRKRIEQLNELRTNQESRLDSLYKKGWYTSAKRTESQINDANDEIISLTKGISDLSNKTFSINDSINSLDTKILHDKSSDVSAELGPIIFVRDLFNAEMSTVVVIFIFMLIFVFDPMAMALVIAINKLFVIRGSTKNKKPTVPEKPDTTDSGKNASIDERFEEINNKTAGDSGLVVKPQIIDNANKGQ